MAGVQAMSAQPRAADPAFGSFAKALLKRLKAAGEDPGPDGGLWTDGALDPRSPGPVHAVGVTLDTLHVVLPALVAEAAAHGLCVLDEQAGAAYLPDGIALTPTGRQPITFPQPPPPDDTLQRRRDVADAINEVLTPALAASGFKPLKRWSDTYAPYKRRFKACDQYLFFGIDDTHDGYVAALMGRIVLKLAPGMRQALELTEKWHDFGLSMDIVAAATVSGLPPSPSPWKQVGPPMGLRSDVRHWVTGLLGMLSQVVLPLADRCADVAGIDAELNTHPHDPPLLTAYGLDAAVVAHLAGNPHADGIAAGVLAATADGRHREQLAAQWAGVRAQS